MQYGKFLNIGKASWKAQRPSGEFNIILAADKDWLTVYLDGKQMLHKQDKTFQSGFLGFTLASGTNKDSGTSCEFTNNELWILK